MPKKKNARRTPKPGKVNEHFTKQQLERLATTNRLALVTLAADYGIHPGRGITASVMINRILQTTGQTPSKKSAKKRAPVKKAAKPTLAKRVTAKGTPASSKRSAAKNGRSDEGLGQEGCNYEEVCCEEARPSAPDSCQRQKCVCTPCIEQSSIPRAGEGLHRRRRSRP